MDADEPHTEFARQVRDQLAASLEAADTPAWCRVRLKDVYPDTAAEWPTAVVLFTDSARPGCVFGTRCSTEVVGVSPDTESTLRLAASICVTNIEEEVVAVDAGLPDDCSEGAITWF